MGAPPRRPTPTGYCHTATPWGEAEEPPPESGRCRHAHPPGHRPSRWSTRLGTPSGSGADRVRARGLRGPWDSTLRGSSARPASNCALADRITVCARPVDGPLPPRMSRSRQGPRTGGRETMPIGSALQIHHRRRKHQIPRRTPLIRAAFRPVRRPRSRQHLDLLAEVPGVPIPRLRLRGRRWHQQRG